MTTAMPRQLSAAETENPQHRLRRRAQQLSGDRRDPSSTSSAEDNAAARPPGTQPLPGSRSAAQPRAEETYRHPTDEPRHVTRRVQNATASGQLDGYVTSANRVAVKFDTRTRARLAEASLTRPGGRQP